MSYNKDQVDNLMMINLRNLHKIASNSCCAKRKAI